jgi:hypothetical protein
MPITVDPAGTNPWYTGYANLHTFVNVLEAEIQAARQGKTNLLTNLLLYATRDYVQSQITTGGIDLGEIGNPLDILRINSAGDAFEGISQNEVTPSSKGALFWATRWI